MGRVTISRNRVLKKDNHSCKLCGDINNLNVHHLIPLQLGGSNDISNLITVCELCHHFMHCNPKHVMLLRFKHMENTRLGCKNAWLSGKTKGRPRKNQSKPELLQDKATVAIEGKEKVGMATHSVFIEKPKGDIQ